MSQARFEVRPVGIVESSLTDLAAAPKQGDEGAPNAWLVFEPAVLDALEDIRVGDRVIVLTWLDQARRDVLRASLSDRHVRFLRELGHIVSAELATRESKAQTESTSVRALVRSLSSRLRRIGSGFSERPPRCRAC